jgi:hypothetical protein
MKKLTWLYLSMVLLITLFAGCSGHPERTEQPADITPTLFFPVQLDKYIGTPYPETLAIGTLVIDGRYLQLKPLSNTGNSSLLIWPPGFSVRAEDNVVHVLNKDGKTIANTGDKIRVSGGQVSTQVVETYIGNPLPADSKGPYWLIGYVVPPSVLASPPTSVPASTANISREQAIETASKTLPSSIVSRADIKAEFHVWYWEVTFGNLNARAEELEPWPLKPPPPPASGQPTTEPYPGIWQSVIITVNAQTGALKSAGAQRAPEPGPYVSEEQAINNAMSSLIGTPPNLGWGIGISWFEKAQAEAYLQGDRWIVLFWETGSQDNHFSVTVNAVTGAAMGGGRG